MQVRAVHALSSCAEMLRRHSRMPKSQASKRRRKNNDENGNVGSKDNDNEGDVSKARRLTTKEVVMELMQDKDQMSLDDLLILAEANSTSAASGGIGRVELEVALTSLDEENKVMFYDDMVHKV